RHALAYFLELRLGRLRQHGQDFVFAEDQDLLAVDLDVGPGVLPEEDLVAHLDVQRELGAVFQDLAVSDGQDLALLGLLLRRVRDDDASLGGFPFLDAANQQTVVKRTHFHHGLLPSIWINGSSRIHMDQGVLPNVRRNLGGFGWRQPRAIAIPATVQTRRVVARALGAGDLPGFRPTEQGVVTTVSTLPAIGDVAHADGGIDLGGLPPGQLGAVASLPAVAATRHVALAFCL